MNDNEYKPDTKMLSLDEEQIRRIAGEIRKCSSELERIRTHSDFIWEQCSALFDDGISKSINEVKMINRRKYKTGIDRLDNYANRLETITGVWRDTENEIMNASKELENFFVDIGKKIQGIIK